MAETRVAQCYLDPKTGHGPFLHDPNAAPANILLVTVDMVPPEFMLRERSQYPARTPGLDRLARDGLFFPNTFATSPLCTPSRAAYLTGRHSYITSNGERGHDGHTVHVREGDSLFPEYIKAAGYHARHAGKCHVGAGRFLRIFGENDAPWDRWSPPWYDDEQYLGFLHAQGLERFEFARSINGRSPAGEGEGNFYGGWIAPQKGRIFPKQATYPAYLVERAISLLDRRPGGNQPFYLQLDFFAPHQPFAIPGGMEEREREIRARLELPRSYRELAEAGFRAPWPEPRVYRLYRRNWGLSDPGAMQEYRVANQLQFELLDELLGRLISYLERQDLYDSTWIAFCPDHGEMNGELGLVDKGAFLHPRVTRAPLIIKAPAGFPGFSRGLTVEAPCSLLDIAPTLLGAVGVTVPGRQDGVSLLATAAGESRPANKPIVFEVWNHVVPNPCVGTVFSAADGQMYSYVYNATDDLDELYCLNTADEHRNCIADPAQDEVRVEALRCLAERMEADPRWFGYSQYLKLEHAELLPAGSGDRQLFLGRDT